MPRALTTFCQYLGQLLCLAVVVASCTTSNDRYGIEDAYLGYVPARIAIFNCTSLPAGVRPADMHQTNVDPATEVDLCKSFDEAVRDAFGNQPYMRGYSSNYILKALTAGNDQSMIPYMAKVWQMEDNYCKTCRTVARSYRETISQRAQWREWLTILSQKVKGVDSVLLPYVSYAYQKQYSDRGLGLSERGAGVTLLLIDTASGNLLWSGARDAVVPVPGTNYADWAQVKARLFVPALWADFPGRIEQ